MGEHSTIEWTSATWNAVVGCSQVSEGCRNCYAETLDRRFRLVQEGKGYRPWSHPNARYNVRVFPGRLGYPLHWKAPRMIFVNSRSDFFHEAIPPAFQQSMWDVMREAKRHTFQILTKRPENILSMLPGDWGDGFPNVWLGVTGETYDWARRRGELLSKVPARLRFLSAEPWLETNQAIPVKLYADMVTRFFDWVIVGGESGHGARMMHPGTALALIQACEAVEVPVMLKQLGGTRDVYSHEHAVINGQTWKQFPSPSQSARFAEADGSPAVRSAAAGPAGKGRGDTLGGRDPSGNKTLREKPGPSKEDLEALETAI